MANRLSARLLIAAVALLAATTATAQKATDAPADRDWSPPAVEVDTDQPFSSGLTGAMSS
ncbi:MAG: hypothetical protein EHM16_14025 [Betaproteobacteria bacterium]|nr:MAG: hypothetical protein EHM16_14025 [Betaproteobacteria bacterium]